jgi:hypothetical protein
MPIIPFTSETAKILSVQAVAARAAKKREREELLSSLMHQARINAATDDVFDKRQVNRVEVQIELLNDQLDKCGREGESYKGQADRLASAVTRLAERLRILKRQPLPGSLRPTAARAPRPAQGPID